MRVISPYVFTLSTFFSLCITACNEEEKSVDTAEVEPDPTDTQETGGTDDTSEDTNDSDAVDSGDTDIIDSGTTTGPEANAVPEFLLSDINPNSSTLGQNISPRDYLQEVSGWYFIKST